MILAHRIAIQLLLLIVGEMCDTRREPSVQFP